MNSSRIQTFLEKISLFPWKQLCSQTQIAIVGVRSTNNGTEIRRQILKQCPNTQIHMSTSCQGLMTEKGFDTRPDTVAVMTFSMENNSFGSAGGVPSKTITIAQLTKKLLHTAELRAGRAGELPSLVWISASPGMEKEVLKSIQDYFTTSIPICGGSPADDNIQGEWWVGDQNDNYPQGIVISLFYTLSKIITHFSAGYQIGDPNLQGTITSCASRNIVTINHRPAAQVYNEWSKGVFTPYVPQGNILQVSTFFPLAVPCGSIGDIPYYKVIHPSYIHDDGSISLFADVEQGDQIVLLHGDEESLIGRGQRVSKRALEESGGTITDIQCALVIFCAGCLLAIQDRMEEVWKGVTKELPNVPIITQFTFGEQGVFPDGNHAHGNLMISVVLWKKPSIKSYLL